VDSSLSPGNNERQAWSPNGECIAFASARTRFVDELLLHPDNVDAQANGEIFVMRAGGSDVRKLTENPWEDATPAWKPFRGKGRLPRLPR
jgi:Tol biopolymer transport system component